jgi:hypothetical protein
MPTSSAQCRVSGKRSRLKSDGLVRGGSGYTSQRLMRLRVLLQFVAIVVIVFTIWIMVLARWVPTCTGLYLPLPGGSDS